MAGEQLGAQLEQLAPPLVDVEAGVGGLAHTLILPGLLTSGR
jgi:hypothetical protein